MTSDNQLSERYKRIKEDAYRTNKGREHLVEGLKKFSRVPFEKRIRNQERFEAMIRTGQYLWQRSEPKIVINAARGMRQSFINQTI